MALASACVDQARLVIKETSSVRVEGQTSFVPVPGQWFRARLMLQKRKMRQGGTGRDLDRAMPHQLLCVTRDIDGNLLSIHGDQRVEVNSVELGRAIWRVEGEPEILRKRRSIIGFTAYVGRVFEHEYDDLLNENVPDLTDPTP